MIKSMVKALLTFGFIVTGAPTQAATLDFSFSFANAAYDGGIITGYFRGLTDNATGSATSVEVVSNSSGFGVAAGLSPGLRAMSMTNAPSRQS